MKSAPTTRYHAIVIGGSIAGCVTAALLARRFQHVTVVDRDELPADAGARAGVPQGRHVHVLLSRGARELETLFPGLRRELIDDGAHLLDTGHDLAWLTPGGWGIRFEAGFPMIAATRDFIESHVRARVRALPNVRVVDRAQVTGLLSEPGFNRVTGVRLRHRATGDESAGTNLAANLVVDASGRESKLPAWLASFGIERVDETNVEPALVYASQFLRVPAGTLGDYRGAYLQASLPDHPRGAILCPVERDRYLLTMMGYASAAPGADATGAVAFASQLRDPIFARILEVSTPLTQPVVHRRTGNRLRHFERVTNWPDGVVALGDAFCAFDPVYGQGMTVAILSALELARRVDLSWPDSSGARAGFARTAQRAIAGVTAPAWVLASSEDLRLPTTTGGRLTVFNRVVQRYFDHVLRVATVSTTTRRRLLAVMNMEREPTSLFHPGVVAGVLRDIVRPYPTAPRPWTTSTSGRHDRSVARAS